MTNNRYHHLIFGPAALERQRERGSYNAYGPHTERDADDPPRLEGRERSMIHTADQFYMSTIAETGWPYIQYRSGPKGFLRILDDTTLGFADFAGNNQFVSAANLDHDDRMALILVDYPRRQRIKIYGRARSIERDDDPIMLEQLKDLGGETVAARCERSIIIDIEAFDWNCTRSIIPRYDKAFVTELSDIYQRKSSEREEDLLGRITELENQLAAVRASGPTAGTTDCDD